MNKRLINDYMELHKIPESGFNEFKTQKYILEQLKELKCLIYELAPTGILVFFDYDRKETIAFRCEMDGLNITEENKFDFKSKHEGFMHACGHDGHMAILLSLAYQLSKIKCPKNICLIFQPSEEVYGGALKVINSNAYKMLNISEIYALHLWPGLKKGKIGSRGKSLMASATEIDIIICGKAAHIAKMDEGIDAIKLAEEMLDILRNESGVIFNCGKISSKGARNIICSEVKLECSLRSFYKIRRKKFLNKLNNIAREISNRTKTNIYINSNNYIPEVKNNLCLFERYRHLIDEVVAPVLQAEDFSFYETQARCLFLFLGVGDTSPLHSSDFCFDLNVLEKGLKTLLSIATTY